MWWWLRLGWRLRKFESRFREVSQMKLSVNMLIQMLALVAQAAAQASDVLPGKGKLWAGVVVAAAQGAVAVLAHFRNPDGSPANQPYQPPR